MIISDGCMALFLGLIIYMSTDFLIGTFLILSAIAAILGGLFLFIPPYPRMGVVGPVLLIPVYAWVMIELPGVAQFATIGIILAVIGLILAVLGYKDSQQRERSRWKPSTPMAHGPPIGQPPPPEYGRRPGGLP